MIRAYVCTAAVVLFMAGLVQAAGASEPISGRPHKADWNKDNGIERTMEVI